MTLTALKGATIAFDLDGTLVDTAPDLIGSLNAVLAEQGIAPVPVEAARALVGRGARALIERGFALTGRPLTEAEAPALVARFIEIYRARIADESTVFEGLEPALDLMAGAGAILCVCTNKPTGLSLLLLEKLGLLNRFASVVGADAAPRPKPDASHLIHAVTTAGGDMARAILVGDSATDVAAARAAKAPSIVVPFGYTEVPARDLGGDAFCARWSEVPLAAAGLLAR